MAKLVGARKLKGEATQAMIVASALKIFARHGFEAASFQAIANDCGLSQPAIFYHFKNREELVWAVIDAVTKHNAEIVAEGMDSRDDAFQRLMKHFEGNVRWGLEHPDEAGIVLLLYYLGSFHPEFSRKYAAVLARAEARVLEHVLAGEREGIFHFTVRAERVAQALYHALLGSFITTLSGRIAARNVPAAAILRELRVEWSRVIRHETRFTEATPRVSTPVRTASQLKRKSSASRLKK